MAVGEETDQDLHGKDNQQEQEQDGSLKNASGFFNGDSSQNHQYLQRTCNNVGGGVASDFGHHQDGILNNNNATAGFFNGDSSLHRNVLETINNGGTGLVSDVGDRKDGILSCNNGAAGFFNGDSNHNHHLLESNNNGGTAALVPDVGVVEDERFYDKVVGAATGFFNGELCQHNLGRSNNKGGVGVGVGVGQFSQDHQSPSNQIVLNQQGPSTITLTLPKSISLKLSARRYPEKLKASSSHAVVLNIGPWRWKSVNQGDLVAKIYYAKKKLVWEFLFGSLKKKMEIHWSHISAINVFVNEDKSDRLEIELNKEPEYHEEINFRAKKHTQWIATNDFTEGHASVNRRHTIVFLPGVLDKPLKNLLECDKRLFDLSQQPFPTHNPPYFHNPIPLDVAYNPVSNNHHIQETTYNAIRQESWFRDQELELLMNPQGIQNHVDLTNNVDSTCKLLEPNYQITSNNGGNDRQFYNAWSPIQVGMVRLNNGGFDPSAFNGGLGLNEPSSLLPPQVNHMNDFNNGGLGLNEPSSLLPSQVNHINDFNNGGLGWNEPSSLLPSQVNHMNGFNNGGLGWNEPSSLLPSQVNHMNGFNNGGLGFNEPSSLLPSQVNHMNGFNNGGLGFNEPSSLLPSQVNHMNDFNNGGHGLNEPSSLLPSQVNHMNDFNNGGHGFNEPYSLLPSQVNNMNDFNNGGDIMNQMGYTNNGVCSFDQSGFNGGFPQASTNGQEQYVLPWEPILEDFGNQAYNPNRR